MRYKMNKRRVRRGGKKFVRPEKGKYKAKNPLPGIHAPDWSNMNLEPFNKNFYREHPNVMNRLRQDVERFRNKHEIRVQGLALNPIESFDEVFMPDYVAREIQNQGYSKPTPIQSQTWPIAFSGFNLVGIAQTGSGKTLAYILPAIVHINNNQTINKPGNGPIAVVLAPTRELAVQIQQVAIEFGSSTHIRTCCTVGGVDKKPQEADLLKGCEIVVATPGRLLDFLSANVTNMRRCTYLVLDEADRMLDMGFEAQIREIISQIRPDKQILMWSATWPREIRLLAEDFLGDYIQVNIGSLELSANHNIKQFVHICQENEKSSKLQLLLRQIYQANNPGKILIFVSKKKRADMISKYINNFGVACESLHGDKPQSQRTQILDDFRSGRSNIIVATDVAARGLDVDGIMYVINLDFPKLIEDYVHRIGRCGRCDRMGISYAFFTLNDAKQATELIAILNEANQPVDAKLQEIANKKPEKIDKKQSKQRQLNENAGFEMPLQQKRQYDDRTSNFNGAGPSSTSVRNVEEPVCKRERITEPESRNLMFDRNSDRDFREDRNVNRGYMDVPSFNLSNSNRADDHSTDLRRLEDRNTGRVQSDGRNINRGFMENQSVTRRHQEDRRINFDGLANYVDDYNATDTGRKAEVGSPLERRPINRVVGLDDLDGRRLAGSANFERGEPSIGMNRMRNIPANNFDQPKSEFGRLNDFRDRPDERLMRDYFDDIQRPIRDNLRDGLHNEMFNSTVADRRTYGRELLERDNHDAFSTKAVQFQDTLNLSDLTYATLPERRSISQEFLRTTPDRILGRSDVDADRILGRSDVDTDRFLSQSREEESFDSLENFGSRRGDFHDRSHGTRFDVGDRRNDVGDRRNDLINKTNEPTSTRWNNFDARDSRDAYSHRQEFSGGMESNRRSDFNLDSRRSDVNLDSRRSDFNLDSRRNESNLDNRRNDFNLDNRRSDFTLSSRRNEFNLNNRRSDFNLDNRRSDFNLDREDNFNFARNNDVDDDFRGRNRRDFERRDNNERFNRFN